MKTITISIYQLSQLNTSQVTVKVDFIDFKTNQLLQTFTITSEFVYKSVYATYKGDKRACETDYYPNFDRKVVPFPSNEQMVYDTGEDLKAKLKEVIVRNRLRK